VSRRTVLALTGCVFLLTACSNRTAPAPVSVLNSQPETIPSAFDSATYTVNAGDTLFAIAWYSGNDYRDLAKWNNLSAPYTIRVGQKLTLYQPKPDKRSEKNSGQTNTQSSKKRVESSKKQAYGESVKAVSHQKVTAQKAAVSGEFPAHVARWVWPAQGKIIETFKQTGDVNKGIDIQAEQGSPVVSAAAGKVVYTGNALRGYGNLVIIKHTETFLSAYAHNNTILVKERQWVTAGEQIATVGNSGANLVKLHFEVRYRGKSLDPLRYLPSR
jgi:lipoprotein NlpD